MKVHILPVKKMVYKNKKLYGINSIDSDKLDENSEFLIASITKLFTAVGLLILQEEKKLNINDTFKKYLDIKELEKVKIIDTMNHVAGFISMSDSFPSELSYTGKKFKNPTEICNRLRGEKIIKHKKGEYLYSPLAYIYLGALIEKVTGMEYTNYITEKILKPLKLNHTGFTDTNISLYNNFYSSGSKKINKFIESERSLASSSGGLKSSIGDLIKFKNFYKLLSEETLKNIPESLKTYFIKDKDSDFFIKMAGMIEGGHSFLKIKYDKNWDNKDFHIVLTTIMY